MSGWMWFFYIPCWTVTGWCAFCTYLHTRAAMSYRTRRMGARQTWQVRWSEKVWP